MVRRGFEFETLNNKYFYDDETCVVVNWNEIDELGPNKTIKASLADEEKVHTSILQQGGTVLTLIVTEDCNLRCKYCIYSDNYDHTRSHNESMMSSEVVLNAVEMYLELVEEQRVKDVLKKPIIGFYGGEPLLNFQAIKTAVEYVNKNTSNSQFIMTTNAVLLTKEKIEFLVKNNFSLSISLNGNKKENDRLRIFKNEKGTFSVIFNKLKYIHDKYPMFYKQNINFITVFDVGTNLTDLAEFYQNNEMFRNKLSVLSKVEEVGSNWYDRYTCDEKNRFMLENDKMLNDCRRKILANEELNEVEKTMYLEPLYHILNRNMIPQNVGVEIRPRMCYAGSCVPGSKIAVSADGNIYLCEKVNQDLPLGNVIEGFKYSNISKLINEYNHSLESKCQKCNVSNMCTLCYKDLKYKNHQFTFMDNDMCSKIEESKKKQFEELYFLLENNIALENLLTGGTDVL